jgi:hypothetical protein
VAQPERREVRKVAVGNKEKECKKKKKINVLSL